MISAVKPAMSGVKSGSNAEYSETLLKSQLNYSETLLKSQLSYSETLLKSHMN